MTTSVRATLIEQTERTRQSSKADIKRFIEESELKITSLESQITALVELRDRERACVTTLEYIISPIRTLPVELLVEIFDLAIADGTHIQDAHRISQVCSDWRQVAHGTPRLWTRPICVDLSDGQGQLYADGLEAWLACSAPLPMSFSFQLDEPNISHRILEIVLKIAPRFRSLCCVTEYFPLSLISRLAECNLDSLEELKLSLADSDPRFPALTMLPRLRKLIVTMYSNERLGHILIFPWAQLIDLTLDSNSLDNILDIITQCTTLTHASICTSGWPMSTTASLAAVGVACPLSHLRTLSLDLGTPEDMIRFWGVVSAPALEALHLNFLRMRGFVHSAAASLPVFLTQSPNIIRLGIVCGPQAPTSHELIVALGHTTRLTHLRLTYPTRHSLDDALIDALSYEDGVTPLVPHLHNLVFREVDEDGFTPQNLERMLLSRWWADAETTTQSILPAVARWTKVKLSGNHSERLMDTIEMLQRRGVPLIFRNP